MNWKRAEYGRKYAGSLSYTVLLAVFFLVGIFLGQVFSSHVPTSTQQELSEYLKQYMMIGSEPVASEAIFSILLLYIRYPLLVILLGFSSIGVLLIPCLTTAFGFFMSFSASCFVSAFGTCGVLLAISGFGLRCLLTLPCYFLLAEPALRASFTLASVWTGKGYRGMTALYGREWRHRLIWCAIILLAGVCVEFVCSPWLLQLVVSRILVD